MGEEDKLAFKKKMRLEGMNMVAFEGLDTILIRVASEIQALAEGMNAQAIWGRKSKRQWATPGHYKVVLSMAKSFHSDDQKAAASTSKNTPVSGAKGHTTKDQRAKDAGARRYKRAKEAIGRPWGRSTGTSGGIYGQARSTKTASM